MHKNFASQSRSPRAPAGRVAGRRPGRTARRGGPSRRGAFTLVEIMVATGITLMMMALVVTIFSIIAKGVTETRASMQMVDRVRDARLRLQDDLAFLTAIRGSLPNSPQDGGGYFEYLEGPVVETFRAPAAPWPFAELISADVAAVNVAEGTNDFTAGDFDDVLMFTARSSDTFTGRAFDNGASIAVESNVAEICWFMRGNTLYRRVLLVMPGYNIDPASVANAGYYFNYDISARQEGGVLDRFTNLGAPAPVSIKPNSLEDLTKRENRFGHQPYVFPHDVRFWGPLRLPTLRECSGVWGAVPAGMWPFPQVEAPAPNAGWGILPGGANLVQSAVYPTDPNAQLIVPAGLTVGQQVALTSNGIAFDLWTNPHAWTEQDPATGVLAQYSNSNAAVTNYRYSEDVILNNVLAFDVKIWDPLAPVLANIEGGTAIVFQPGDPNYLRTYVDWVANGRLSFPTGAPGLVETGAYVDLNYLDNRNHIESQFSGPGFNTNTQPFSPAQPLTRMTYDTWSDHYESDGIDQDLDGTVDEGTNGIDDDGDGVTDEVGLRPNGVDDDGDGAIDEADEVDEQEAPPPYAFPLRGIQIKIRVFEPTSRQVREFTVVQETLPE